MRLTVNGREHLVDAEQHATLLEVLRGDLGLTGAKLVCDRGECGACTVLLDGAPVYACLALAAACEGGAIITVEGLTQPGSTSLHPLQDAFIRHDATQCGFCTPGQLLAAAALLARLPDPTDEEIRTAMSGNLCRCGTYPRIVLAVRSAGRVLRERAHAP